MLHVLTLRIPQTEHFGLFDSRIDKTVHWKTSLQAQKVSWIHVHNVETLSTKHQSIIKGTMQQQITERSCGYTFIGRFLYSCFYKCLLRYRRTNVKPEKLISTINFFLFFFCLLFFVLRKQLRLSFNCMTPFTIIGLIICENNTVIITLFCITH